MNNKVPGTEGYAQVVRKFIEATTAIGFTELHWNREGRGRVGRYGLKPILFLENKPSLMVNKGKVDMVLPHFWW